MVTYSNNGESITSAIFLLSLVPVDTTSRADT